MNTTIDRIHNATSAAADSVGSSPAYQAYRILHFGFVVAPILAGLDKFFHLLVNWDQYLPGVVANVSPIPPQPRIFAYVVAAWLAVIIINLLLIPGYFDVALRDFGLLLAALALGALSQQFARK
jgi:hypothetical protein